MTLVAGRQLYPRQTEALARAKLLADLPVAYQYLSGVSQSASAIFRQVLTINAMNQAMHGFAGASGTTSVDVFAQTRADIQTERTYSSIAHNAMKWVPILNVVLTVVFYALFPVLFPLFLMPRSGPLALRGYVTGFFYLAAWGPLFVILHMILMFKGASDVAAASGSTGLSLANFGGMSDVNSDIGVLAGYLVASVPFLAGGVAKGAMAISTQATSYLNPSQNAAEEAAREASTGNVSLGNSNIDNSSVFSRQFAQGNLSQAYREWGMAEIEANRDYYGPVHFDDIEFQMSAQGQQLQARFVESYADRLHGDIADDLVLPAFAPISRPDVSSQSDVRGSVRLGGPPRELSGSSGDREEIEQEVARVQERGEQRVDRVTDDLEGRTRDARGASAEAADNVKKW